MAIPPPPPSPPGPPPPPKGIPLSEEEMDIYLERLSEINKSSKELFLQRQEELKQLQDIGAKMIENGEALEHSILIQNKHIELGKASLRINKEELKALQDKIALGEALTEEESKRLAFLEKEIPLLEQFIKQQKEAVENQKEMNELGKEFADKVFGVSKNWEKSWFGKLAKSDDIVKSLKHMAAGFLQAMRPANMLGSALMQIQTQTLAAIGGFSQQAASLATLTGQGYEYNSLIMEVSDSNRQFGVGMKESAQAIGELFVSMSNFNNLSKDVQASLVAHSAQLERLGVSTKDTAEFTEQFMLGMGMTADEAMKANQDIAKLAMGIGYPVAEMSNQFRAALPALASYGKQAPEIFKKVMSAAKNLGAEIQTLLGFTAQFDTYEDAASAVGKLNNILGGDLLNTYEMINSSEEERIESLLRGVDASNMSWNSMSRYEKMALANAAGIKDMAEANKIFAGGLKAYQESQAMVRDNSISQAELEKRTQATVSIQEKMNMIMESFILIIQPIVEVISWLLNGILSLNDAMGGMLVPVLVTMLGLFVLWQNSTKAQAFLTGILQALNISLATSTTTAGTAAAGASTGVTALAGSMAALGTPPAILGISAIAALALGIGLAAAAAAIFVYSLVQLITIFMKMPEAILPAIGGMALFLLTLVGFIGLIALMLPIAPAFMTSATLIGAGMMALAPGFILLSAALFLFSESLKNFEEVMEIMYELPWALGLFALGLAISGPLMLTAATTFGAGATVVGIGLLLLGTSLSLFNNETVELIPTLGVSLILLGLTLIAAGILLDAAAIVFGIGAIAVGAGLLALGLGLLLFKEETVELIPILGVALISLAATLIAAGIFMDAAAVIFGIGAIAVGAGLLLLGLGLLLFKEETVELIAPLGAALILLAFTLMLAGIFMNAAAVGFGIAAITVGAGLLALGIGLLLFSDKTVDLIAPLGAALLMLGLSLVAAGIPLALGGALLLAASIFLLPAAIFIAPALHTLGSAIKALDIEKMISISQYFIPFATALFKGSLSLLAASFYLAVAGDAIGMGIWLMEDNLQILAERMEQLNPQLESFANLGPKLREVFAMLEETTTSLSSLENMEAPLNKLANFIDTMGTAQMSLGASSVFTASFSEEISKLAESLNSISTEKIASLQGVLTTVASIEKFDSISQGLNMIADGIWNISFALSSLEEIEALSFAALITSVSDASVKVTPEGIENVKSLVELSAEYSKIQAETRVPEQDSFIEALKSVFGVNKSKDIRESTQTSSGGNKEIVLKVDNYVLGKIIGERIEKNQSLVTR